jgi:hypothetical protein
MPHKRSKPFYPCLWRLLSAVLVVCFTALTSAAAHSAGNSAWKITVSGKTSTVCYGDKILFMLRWQPNPNFVNPLSSLTGEVDDESLVPLTGPKQLLAKANNGTFEPEVHTPGTGAGVQDFTYKAEKLGTETITFQAFDDNLEVDASVSKTFEVKSCDYRFTLMVKDDLITTTDHGPLGMFHVLQASGTLIKSDPLNLNLYEAFDMEISDTYTVTQTMDCTVSIPDYGHIFGLLDAKALKDDDGGINLKLGPPKNFKVVAAYTISCPDSEPQSVSYTMDVSGGNDPWIEKNFSLSEGTESIDSFALNPALAQMQADGFHVTSSAWLMLEKVVK